MTQSLYDLRRRFVWEMYQAIRHVEPFDDAEKVLEEIVKAKQREAKAAAKMQAHKTPKPRAQAAPKQPTQRRPRAAAVKPPKEHKPPRGGFAPRVSQEGLPEGWRRCKCGHEGPLSDFDKSKRHKDGHSYNCLHCHREAERVRRLRMQALRSNLENSSKYTAQNS